MSKIKRIHAGARYLSVWGICALVCTCHLAWANIDNDAVNDKETFVFAGTCFNGEPYRLHWYQKNIEGQQQSFYDYAGPAGKGVVQSDTSPKTMAARVCRHHAEIISARYWE